jgi:PAS domain S-box-containing protein
LFCIEQQRNAAIDTILNWYLLPSSSLIMTHETSTSFQIPEPYYTALFEALAGNNVLLQVDTPRFTILAASQTYLKQTDYKKEVMIGKGIFEAFPGSTDPNNTGTRQLLASLNHVLQFRESHQLPIQRYDTAGEDGRFVERYWKASNKPVFSAHGDVAYIIHSAEDITDEVKAKKREEQIEGVQKAYNLFMQAPAIISITRGLEHVLELVNESALALWGKEHNIIGKPLMTAIPEIKGQGIVERFDEVMKTGQQFIDSEVPVSTNRTGVKEDLYFDVVYKPYYEKNSSVPAGVFAISHEVTEVVMTKRKIGESKEALRQSEQDLRTMVLQAPIGICVMDAATLITEIANDKFLEIAGRPLNEIVGWMYWDTFREAKPYYEDALNRVVQEGITFHADEVEVPLMRHGKKQIVHVTFVYEPLMNTQGEVKKVAVWVLDNTPQVKARRRVEESEERFRSMADASPVMIWTLDEAGNSTYYNTRAAEFTGHKEEELKEGKSWQVAIHPDDIEFAAGVVGNAVMNRIPYQMECRMQRADGAWRWLLNHGTPRFGRKGEYFGFVGSSIDITEHKNSQQALQTALEQMRLSKEAAELGTFDMDVEKGTMHWDDRCRTLFGISHHNVVTFEKDFINGLYPADRERVTEVVNQLFNKSISNGDYDVEYRTVGAEDGIIRWVRAKGKVYFNEQEKPIRFIGSVLDITPQVSARKEIAESEAKYRTLFESMDQGYCTLQTIFEGDKCVDYRYLETNPTFERHLGMSGALGKTIRELAPDIEPKWFDFYGGVALTGIPIRIEEESKAFNKWFEVYAIRVGDAEERKVGVFFTDVTGRKKAEENIRESETRFRTLADDSPMFVFIIDADPLAPVSYWNKTWLTYTGQTYQETLGRAWNDIIHADDIGVAMQHYNSAFEKREPYYIPAIRVRRNDGEYRWHAFKGNPRFFANGVFDGYIGVGFDVHQQKVTEEKLEELVAQRTHDLQRANTELKRSNQNLEEFAHAASHDLKEPVRKIHFFTNRLKDQLGPGLEEEQARAFARIQNAAERMGNLIDDLLLYSHVSQRPHETESIDLNHNVQHALEDLELDIEEKQAVIQVGKLPGVQGYRRQLQQMFQNLISNALKYSKKDTPPQIQITATVVTEAESSYHVISIQDNGIGFEPEYADKIFQMFTRLHGKAEYSGTGVGLSIVKKVVDNHNGFIRVESVVGKGSVFKVYLPV